MGADDPYACNDSYSHFIDLCPIFIVEAALHNSSPTQVSGIKAGMFTSENNRFSNGITTYCAGSTLPKGHQH